jgi:hypothetical protein
MYLLLIAVVSFTAAGPAVAALTTPAEAQQTDTNQTQTVMYYFGEQGDGAALRNITWDGAEASITIHADEYTTVSASDAGVWVGIEEGSGQGYNYQTYTIPEDTTRTIKFSVDPSTGVRAISLTAHSEGYGYVEEKNGQFLADESASWDAVAAGVAASSIMIGGVVILFGLLTWVALRRDYRRVI